MLTAKEFYEDFTRRVMEDKIYKDGRTYFEIYKSDEPTFTELVNKSVIHDIVVEHGLTAQHEYFRIDTVGWLGKHRTLDKDRAKEIGLNRHLWDLKIAVEHENNKEDWLDEVIKLIHICCPLKVIIGYNYSDLREENEQLKLSYTAECMQKIDAFKAHKNEQYLIIIGNGAPKDKTNPTYDSFDYRAYLYSYDTNKFEKI